MILEETSEIAAQRFQRGSLLRERELEKRSTEEEGSMEERREQRKRVEHQEKARNLVDQVGNELFQV